LLQPDFAVGMSDAQLACARYIDDSMLQSTGVFRADVYPQRRIVMGGAATTTFGGGRDED
jgi:hypothetical protein